MIERYSFMPASFFQRGSLGSLRKLSVTVPRMVFDVPLSEASSMMFVAAETVFMITRGLQRSRFAYTIDWIANFGVAKTASTFAPEALSLAIWEETSAAVTSYGWAAITFEPEPASPFLSPKSRSFP